MKLSVVLDTGSEDNVCETLHSYAVNNYKEKKRKKKTSYKSPINEMCHCHTKATKAAMD